MSRSKTFNSSLMYWSGAFIVLIAINIKLIALDYIVTEGRTILVPLYFAEENDFKSNGYMTIHYENIIPDTNFEKNEGFIVISNDINDVAIYSRLFSKDMPVEIGEFLLQYQLKQPYGFFSNNGMVRVVFGSEKFYFKELGLLQHYTRARYAVLKVADNGSSVLFGLADMNYQDLGRFF